jgi:hypothetical protein
VQLEFASLKNGFLRADRVFLDTLDGVVNGAVDGGRSVEGLIDDAICAGSEAFDEFQAPAIDDLAEKVWQKF